MIDQEKKQRKQHAKEKIQKRIRVQIDEDNYEYIPERKQTDYYDNTIHQRVAVYVRVSTDDVRQTTSYELQKKYYEDFVVRHPNWTLVQIYADEGISGTSLAHRDAFNQMIVDCRAGKIDLILTKSVSRFARNVLICIGMVRELAELKPPVGVFFESECIFSLNDDSQMALSFQATMAEEESHIRSRSMETSLRMRLDNGVPLTPKLLGYTHNSEGKLIINPEEAPTVKLAFYMYLFGYSTQQIADTLNALGRKSYLGNVKWTSNGVVQILRNERHCGDVLTRKTFTPNFRDHLARKNRGERPQSRYFNHHDAIISRDDYIAVQQMLDNAKYGHKAYLPELRVIDSGILRGFVTINPRWGGFAKTDYDQAAGSVYSELQDGTDKNGFTVNQTQVELMAGDFDLRGFEVARPELFDSAKRPYVIFHEKKILFSAACVRKFGEKNYIEMLVNPVEKRFAIRPAEKGNRSGVLFSKISEGKYRPRPISAAAFYETIYDIFGWKKENKYRIIGTLYEQDGEQAYIFDITNTEAFFKSYVLPTQAQTGTAVIQPLTPSGKRVRAIPESWAANFGKQYYEHEQTMSALENQSEKDWKLRLQGRLFETGAKISVTKYSELRAYIKQELNGLILEETGFDG